MSSRLDNRGNLDVSDLDIEQILDVINVSWAKGTREVYGAGLLVYHVFCDLWNVPEEERGPAPPILIIAFILNCAGVYAGGTLANYIFAI